MKLPPLTSLQFFDRAARHESFVKAAEELNVTHSAVSRQIRLLEAHLGTELFERRNRAVFLTVKGKLLFQTTAHIFEQLNGTVAKLQTQVDVTTVSLSCEPTIAMKWLIPRLTDFYAKYPDITVHLVAAGGPIDFARMNIDLALRRNDFKWHADTYSLRICAERMGVVQRPEMIADAWQSMTLLSTASRPSAWHTWQQITRNNIQEHKELTYEHFYLCIQAALAGQGVALASFLMVVDDVQAGQLTAPNGFIEDGSAYYLLAPKEIKASSSIGIFTHWLLAQVNESVMMSESQ